jgi:2-polyprenyl-6-methoxyphenol hydroxylase-like FAD-dependent oxidoreductase
LGLRREIEEKSCDIAGARFWRSWFGQARGGDVAEARVWKWRFLNGVKNLNWCRDIETHMQVMNLQAILLQKFEELGGEVRWGKKLEKIEGLEGGTTKVGFRDGENVEVDLLVGADWAWSEARKFILRQRNEETAMKKWVPDFMGANGFYGISRIDDDNVDPEILWDTHGIWLDQGNLSSSPLPDGKIRWDLIIPEREAPHYSATTGEREGSSSGAESGWEHRIAPAAYSNGESVQILRRHAGLYHPVTGTFGRMLATSVRIIRSPLRQHVWKESEIRCGNVAVIGDAARLMLPSSGQGNTIARFIR